MATIPRGVAAGFSNRLARHLVVRLRSQTGQDCSVMPPRSSPWIVNSCNIHMSKLSQAPLGHMKKKCFLPGIIACVQEPGELEPEEPGDDLPEIVESTPKKELLDDMTLKKAANGAANNETSSKDDFTSSESNSGLTTDEDTNNRNELPVGVPVGLPVLKIILKALKSQGAILNYLKKRMVSNYEQVILTVIGILVWIKAFYDLGLNQGDLFHVLCPVDNHHRYCVTFLEFVHKYFR